MSAKNGLLRWLGAFVAFDIVVLGGLLTPQLVGAVIDAAHITGVLTTLLAPPVLFLLNTIIPQSFKHMLVFWRVKNVLPSHRAFSVYAEIDPRVSVSKLKQRVGEFPVEPRDQQDTWFGIYQRHKADAAVVDAHRSFLIFRDLAALSFLLALTTPLLLCAYGFGIASWSAFAIFGGQYLLAAVASRQAGGRLVCTVLSLESHL